MVDLDRRLAVIASLQHSVISLADVRNAGGTRRHANERVHAGRWEQVYEGVYRITGVPWTYEARVMALIFAAGPGACASHMCAARLSGMGFPNAAPEISVPRGRNCRTTGQRVHESTDLDRCQVVVRNGVAMTDPARTLLDLGRYIRAQALARAVQQARRQELVDWHDLIACLTAHARCGRHGIRRLRQVIAEGAATNELTDTDSELAALGLLRENGFGEPAVHHQIRDGDGEILAEFDLAYPEQMVAFEIDGSVHLRPEVKRNDESRDYAMRRDGWTIRRIWWEIPIREPDNFVRIVRQTLRNATKPSP